MAKRKRKQFFHLRYPPLGGPVYWDELGSQVKIVGMVVSGGLMAGVLLLPGHSEDRYIGLRFIAPTPDEWIAILQHTDMPEIFELDATGAVKAVHRKTMRQVGAAIQWGVWRRDGFRCMYCGRDGGVRRPLSVDHFIPVELGGTDVLGNLLSACRACNQRKGAQPPEVFCEAEGNLDFEGLKLYLAGKATALFIAHLAT